ncbi:ran-binding protein 3-like isoform X1 [Salmo salar]|uniref:Ran-binding protein 3-like isoform X1 n=1 Tax=Salmo salar TaxID=8030 RepID=A0A1S3KZT8_SALSA|nr:ran-binding protein 3-like isoform X1 [Salmo salar]|eukprot:XP_013983814.1 PREDICTED: ran-binding protein 3-like isoform X1 [Salmo salar]
MRGNLSPNEDISAYYSMMPVSDFHENVPCTVEPTESVCGAAGPVTSRPRMGNTSLAQDGGCAQDVAEELKEKTVLAPPMFIFQKKTPSMKRSAERWEEGSVMGISPNKRVRSLTNPNPNNRTRKGSCDGSRRVRSSSLAFPPRPPVSRSNVFMPSNLCNQTNISQNTVSPLNRVRRSLLQPARLLVPQPWNISSQPHLSEVSHDLSDDCCSVTTDHSSTVSGLHLKTSPQVHRATWCQRHGLVPSSDSEPADLSADLWFTLHRSKADTITSDRVQFVFGENMGARVLRPQKLPSSEHSDCSSSNSESSTFESSHKGAVWSSLRESAAAYTESCGRQRVLRRVQLFTGEEKESNVVQLTCRLFVLEKGTQAWNERGRGVLRLNDLTSGTKGGLQSRIVMRHQGSLKVILNTKLWPHTHLRRPARRNLQVTATDVETQAVRVFLIQASARDVARLYVAIHHRLVALRASAAGREAGAAGGRTREGHCNSENEEEEEQEEQRQRQEREGLLVTRLRPVDCDWIHSKPSLYSW